MKIVDVKAYVIEQVFDDSFAWRQGVPGSGDKREHIWLRLITDEGIEGFARFWKSGFVALDLIRRYVPAVVIGADPLQKELLWHRLWEVDRSEGFPTFFLGLVDIALWDITAKAAGLPLYQLLGGYRDRIQSYASTTTFGDEAVYLEIVDQCLDYGFKAIKLHAWGDVKRDLKLCQKVRSHVGEEIVLMYDASGAFNVTNAIYLGRGLHEANYYWYEEPVRETGVAAYRRLCESLDIAILAGETSAGFHHTMADFIMGGAADMIRTSVQYKGGFTGALRVAHLADAFQMDAQVHGHGIENLNVCLAIRNNDYYETMITQNPIAVDPRIGRDGTIAAPTLPGLGYDIEVDFLEKTAVAKL